MLDKIKQMYELKQKAEQVKRELESTDVEASAQNNQVKIVISGSQKVKSLEIADSLLGDKEDLQSSLVNCINNAIRNSQELAARKMKEITGINIPGL